MRATVGFSGQWHAGWVGREPFVIAGMLTNRIKGLEKSLGCSAPLGSRRLIIAARSAPATVVPGNPVSQRYTLVGPALAQEEPPRRWWQRLLQVHRRVDSWLRRVRQRRALIKLNGRLLRDIGLSPDHLPAEAERRACAIPFRLPRQ